MLGGSSRKHEQSQSSDSHLTVDLTDNVNETEADHDKTLVDNVAGAKSKRKAASPPLVFDELDALEFVVVFDRYQRRFHSLSPGQKLKSPDPYTCIEALTARYDALRRARSTTVNTPMPDGALLQPPTTIEDDDPNLPTPFDVGLDPVKQPLRSRFNMMIQRYLGPIAGFPTEDLQKGNGLDRTISGRLSLPGLVGQKSDDKSPLPPNSSIPTVPRLSWMVDLGLLSEQAIGQALSEAEITTHPDVLAHIADLVSSHLSAHVLPAFLAASTRNLSGRTTHGRLTIAIVSLILAVLFSVLLLLDPSPLYVGSHGGSSRQPGTYNARPDAFAGNSSHPGWGHVSRWWRITTAPLWGAGIGYFIAARTGVCVWLTIRGNREPGEAEEREREQIRSRISSDAGFSFADLDSDAGMGQRGDGRKPWLAPELMGLVAKVTGNRDRSSGMGLSKSDSRTGDATEMTTVSNTPTTAPRSSTWPRLLTPPMPSVSAFDTLAHAFDARQRSSSVGGTPANAGAGVSSGQYGLGMRYAGGALEPLNEHQGAPSAAVSQAPSCVPTPAATAAAIPASSDAAPWAEPPARMSHPIVPPAINDTYFSPAAALLPTPSLRKKSLPGLPISLGIVKTPSTGLAPAPAAAAPHPAMRSARVQPPSKHRMRIHRLWLGIQQRTGFAVRTEHVQDERVRRAQQRIALSALLRCTAGTLLVLIVLVAIP